MSATAAQMQRPTATWGMYLPYIVPMLISTASTILIFTNSSLVGWAFIVFLVLLQVMEPVLGEGHETYEWKNSQWSVPVNVVVTKIVKIGDQMTSIGGGVRYWADSPDTGPDGWGYRFVFTLLFPK